MITVISQFKFAHAVPIEKAREAALSTAPRYRGVPGLIRKYYTLAADGMSAGGIYLWKSREDADRMYNSDEWRAFVRGRYGCEPTLTYLETPVVVDNIANEIFADS
jgi:hypothetical protein